MPRSWPSSNQSRAWYSLQATPPSTVLGLHPTTNIWTTCNSWKAWWPSIPIFLRSLHREYPTRDIVSLPFTYTAAQVKVSGPLLCSTELFMLGSGSRPWYVSYQNDGWLQLSDGVLKQAVEYFADFLLAHYDSDPEIRAFVDKYDFYLYPVVNPDGMPKFSNSSHTPSPIPYKGETYTR